MLQRALLAAFQCVHLPSFPFFLLCFCPSFPYSPHVLHFILVLLVSYISSFPFSLSLSDLFCCCISFIPTFFFHFGSSSSVFPSLLISFHVPSSFLCLFLLSFVLLSFLLYLNLTSSFFLVFYIYSHRASDLKSDLSVWFFGDIYWFYWSMTAAAIFVFHSSVQPGGREALLNLISFGMTLIMRPGNLR